MGDGCSRRAAARPIRAVITGSGVGATWHYACFSTGKAVEPVTAVGAGTLAGSEM